MKRIIVSFMALGMLIASCEKENTPDNAAKIEGTYTFKYLTAKTASTLTADNEKLVSSLDYTSTENKGTIVFASSKMTSSGFGYTINSETKNSYYIDDKLIDTDSQPLEFTVPVTNASTTYKLVGSDSIYFPEGGFISGLNASGNTALMASGGRYTFDGKTFTLLQNVYKDSSYTESGHTYHTIQTVKASVILEKQ